MSTETEQPELDPDLYEPITSGDWKAILEEPGRYALVRFEDRHKRK